MRCPNDKKTRMVESSDYLNWCPHCRVERYAVRRNINDLKRADGGVLDFSREKNEILAGVSDGFRGLVEKAYDEYHKELTRREE